MPKTVLASKFQEWTGLDRISLIVHEMKCIFRELSKDDFGIDGEIEIVVPKADGHGYETTGGIIKLQSKSGASYVKQDSATSFTSPLNKNDMELWHKAIYPTIYVVYHPGDDKLYWKDVKSYLKGAPNIWQPPFKMIFDKATDEFSPGCFNSIHKLATNSNPSRLSFVEKERLFSNLLRVNRLPKVWSAPTEKTRERIRGAINGFVPPFTVFGGRLYTLSDMNQTDCVLTKYCDALDIHLERHDQWWEDETLRREYVYLLNQLLGFHCRRCGIRYNKAFNRNYLPREDQKQFEFKRSWYNVRTQRTVPSRTIAKFYTYGNNSFWRHQAAELSFKLIRDTWYLQVIPKYFFTADGVTPWGSEKVGEYTTQIKAVETNLNVLNHVLFWVDALSQAEGNSIDKQEIIVQLGYHPVLRIEKVPLFGIAPFSIPFDPATYEESEPSMQANFFETLGQPEEDSDDD